MRAQAEQLEKYHVLLRELKPWMGLGRGGLSGLSLVYPVHRAVHGAGLVNPAWRGTLSWWGCLAGEPHTQQLSKQVQVDFQDLGYETCGRSETEVDRDETTSPGKESQWLQESLCLAYPSCKSDTVPCPLCRVRGARCIQRA